MSLDERDKEILWLATVLRKNEVGPQTLPPGLQNVYYVRYTKLLDEKIADQSAAISEISRLEQEITP